LPPDRYLARQNLEYLWFCGQFLSLALPVLISVFLGVSGGDGEDGEGDGFPVPECNYSPPSLSYSV
jgi:hypothetical protein